MMLNSQKVADQGLSGNEDFTENIDENGQLTWQEAIGLDDGLENDYWISLYRDGQTVLSNNEVSIKANWFLNISFPEDSNSPHVCDLSESESSTADIVLYIKPQTKCLYAKLKCHADSSQFQNYRYPDGEDMEQDKDVEILCFDDLFETLESPTGIECDPRNLKVNYENGKKVSVGIKSRAAAVLFVSLADRPFSRQYRRVVSFLNE